MDSVKNVILTILCVLFSLAITNSANAGSKENGHTTHWGYEGEAGPEHWGDLEHEFEACKEGKKQSPIDITSTSMAKLKDLEFGYNTSPLNIVNNGHTIQINYEKGSSIRVNGKKYDLLQLHFHTPSEHKVNGKAFDIEAHLVHKNRDGELAVVGVLLKEGKNNSFIQTLWNNLPEKEGHENSVKGVKINANELLPGKKSYYNYSGSLTTPPCSEGVNWNVLINPVEISADQIARFKSIFEMNTRPVQPLNKRTVKESHQ